MSTCLILLVPIMNLLSVLFILHSRSYSDTLMALIRVQLRRFPLRRNVASSPVGAVPPLRQRARSDDVCRRSVGMALCRSYLATSDRSCQPLPCDRPRPRPRPARGRMLRSLAAAGGCSRRSRRWTPTATTCTWATWTAPCA